MEDGHRKVDLNYRDWSMRSEQLAYRDQVGVNPQYALAKLQAAFQTAAAETADANGDPDFIPAALLDLDPRYLVGFLWITERRENPALKFDDLLDSVPYEELVVAFVEAAAEAARDAEEDKAETPLVDEPAPSEKPSSPQSTTSSPSAKPSTGRSTTSRTSHSASTTTLSAG